MYLRKGKINNIFIPNEVREEFTKFAEENGLKVVDDTEVNFCKDKHKNNEMEVDIIKNTLLNRMTALYAYLGEPIVDSGRINVKCDIGTDGYVHYFETIEYSFNYLNSLLGMEDEMAFIENSFDFDTNQMIGEIDFELDVKKVKKGQGKF